MRHLDRMELHTTELSRAEEAHLDMILAHDLWCKKHRGNHGRNISMYEALSIFGDDSYYLALDAGNTQALRALKNISEGDDTQEKKLRAKSLPMIDVVRRYGYEPRMNKINCCFHEDPGASLHVYEDSWYCFGCGKGGDQIEWVMKMQKCTFLEAINYLT